MNWALTVINPHLRPACLADLAAAAEEIGQWRWTLRQVIALADAALTLTERKSQPRLLAPAGCAR